MTMILCVRTPGQKLSDKYCGPEQWLMIREATSSIYKLAVCFYSSPFSWKSKCINMEIKSSVAEVNSSSTK